MSTEIQRMLYDSVYELSTGENVFLTGPAGVGKTELLKHVIRMRPSRIGLGVTATTGIAANLINGLTLNSFLGIGLGQETTFNLVKIVRRNKTALNRWLTVNMLIIDEVGMLSESILDKLNRVAKILRSNEKPFGGIRLLFSGDFLQLPCINGRACFQSKTWMELQFKIFYLTKSYRQLDDAFRLCLNNARLGMLSEEDETLIQKACEDNLKLSSSRHIVAALNIKSTKIFCKNVDVDEINDRNIANLNSSKIFRYDADVVLKSEEKLALEIAMKRCNAQQILRLVVGAQVMLIVNLDQTKGLINGSRGVVSSFDSANCPIVSFKGGETRSISYYMWEIKRDDCKVIAEVHQIPLKLAYAVTVHKSQGCTIDAAVIDLKDVFEFGQAYVAISRVKSLDSLIVYNFNRHQFKADPTALRYYENLIAFEKEYECDGCAIYKCAI